MKTTLVANKHRWALGGLLLLAAAALSAAGKPATRHEPEAGIQQPSALEFSRDLLALHRMSDPSPFRCYLCRLEPTPSSSSTVRISAPADCNDSSTELRRL